MIAVGISVYGSSPHQLVAFFHAQKTLVGSYTRLGTTAMYGSRSARSDRRSSTEGHRTDRTLRDSSPSCREGAAGRCLSDRLAYPGRCCRRFRLWYSLRTVFLVPAGATGGGWMRSGWQRHSHSDSVATTCGGYVVRSPLGHCPLSVRAATLRAAVRFSRRCEVHFSCRCVTVAQKIENGRCTRYTGVQPQTEHSVAASA